MKNTLHGLRRKNKSARLPTHHCGDNGGSRSYARAALASALLVRAVCAWGQTSPNPVHELATGVTGAFEGWFKNPDGSYSLLLGYYNRSRDAEVDIAIGPGNDIEPGGPDRGQPTHFMPDRNWGMFVVKVPSDFGTNRITWTLTVNGQTAVIPASLNPDYEVSPLIEAAVGNTPPVIRLEENGPSVQGPLAMSLDRRVELGEALSLPVWAFDDAKFTSATGARPKNLGAPVLLHWTKYRGPGAVKFSDDRPEVVPDLSRTDAFSGKAITAATFSEPGEYQLHVVANDYSGDGGLGFQCCWTTALVKVSVQP